MPPRVLITDGEQRSVVAAVRGLAAAGYAVTVTASSSPAAAQWSRDCARRLHAPAANADGGDALAAVLRAELERDRYAAVIPGSDAALRALSRHRAELEPLARLGLPAEGAIERALDKLDLLELAERHGLDAPASRVCASPAELAECAAAVGYPLMLKPARSVNTRGAWRTQMSVIVRAPGDLALASATLDAPYTLQRFHEGSAVVSVAGVIDEGVLLAVAVARYTRTWPPQAGSASASVTIDAARRVSSSAAAPCSRRSAGAGSSSSNSSSSRRAGTRRSTSTRASTARWLWRSPRARICRRSGSRRSRATRRQRSATARARRALPLGGGRGPRGRARRPPRSRERAARRRAAAPPQRLGACPAPGPGPAARSRPGRGAPARSAGAQAGAARCRCLRR